MLHGALTVTRNRSCTQVGIDKWLTSGRSRRPAPCGQRRPVSVSQSVRLVSLIMILPGMILVLYLLYEYYGTNSTEYGIYEYKY